MIKNFEPQWYLGAVVKINDETLLADIDVFGTGPQKNCVFFGVHSSEIKIGDDVLILMMSRELFLYTPLRIDSFLGLQKGTSAVDLTTPGTITIKADNVIVESPNIKLGSNGATFIPLTKEDVDGQFIIAPSGGGPCTFSGIPKSQKVKIE